MENNEFKGYGLFNDIEDASLRARNRAVTLTNIAEAHTKEQRISPGGAALMIGYMNQISLDERKDTIELFVKFMKERGYELA